MTYHKYTDKRRSDNSGVFKKSAYVVPTTVEHAKEFANIIRDEDKAEVIASHGGLMEGLIQSILVSDFCETIMTPEGDIAGIYGVCPLGDGTASPWFLSSVHLPKVRLEFLRGGREWIERVNEIYPILTNCVDADYTVSINWLKFLGFTFIKRHENYGVNPKPFLEFVRIGKKKE